MLNHAVFHYYGLKHTAPSAQHVGFVVALAEAGGTLRYATCQ